MAGHTRDEIAPRNQPGYHTQVAEGRIRLPPALPPAPLPGLSAGHRFQAFIAALVVGAIVLVNTISWLGGFPDQRIRLLILVLAAGGWCGFMAGMAWVNRRMLRELDAGYTTLTIDFGGFAVGAGRRWSDVGRRAPWDYRGTWVYDHKGAVLSAPDTEVDGPGFYPSPSRPEAEELWSGVVWMAEYRNPEPVRLTART